MKTRLFQVEPIFKHELGSIVIISSSGERGLVVARAQYLHSESAYSLRYANTQGVAVEQWWPESAVFSGEASGSPTE